MKKISYKQIIAKKNSYKEKLLKANPYLVDTSGIYILTREEEGFKYAYVGQAKHILTRLAEHLMGYELHIDKSLKKHKLFSEENPTGWQIGWLSYSEQYLNDYERDWIKQYASMGYQMLNKTSGGQDEGKFAIAEQKSPKGYRDGVEYGCKKTRKEVKEYFDKYLDYEIKGKTNKIKERKLKEFEEFLD
jgi:hypothetical protein